MKHVFLFLFLSFSIIHLYHSFLEREDLRRYSKPFLMLTLLGFYFFSAEKHDIFIILALLFSWAGDVVLIIRNTKAFFIGGIFFLIAHLFYITAYLRIVSFEQLPLFLLVVAVVYCTISVSLVHSLKKWIPRKIYYPMHIYLLCNALMNVCALLRCYQHPHSGCTLSFIGAFLFFCSDCILFLVDYHENKNLIFRKHFSVMITYLCGQFLIVLGLILTK